MNEYIKPNNISKELSDILTTFEVTHNIRSAVFKLEKLMGKVYKKGMEDYIKVKKII